MSWQQAKAIRESCIRLHFKRMLACDQVTATAAAQVAEFSVGQSRENRAATNNATLLGESCQSHAGVRNE